MRFGFSFSKRSMLASQVEIRDSALIRGVRHVRLEAHGDTRGRFLETFRKAWFPERDWSDLQINLSTSAPGVLRGLHFHLRQVDYWFPVSGRIRVGLFDLRRGSPTEGRRELFELDAREPLGLFIPVGVAHGYCALTESTLAYLVDAYFDGSDELGVAWDDPDIAMPWDVRDPMLSPRDLGNRRLSAISMADLPKF